MNLQYWFMLPVSIVVATIAMASGVEGATFFSPLFILALKLPPEVAIGTALITEVFGFASGLIAYARKRLIDYRLGMSLLIVTIPLAILGTWLSGIIDSKYLMIILGVGLFVVALSFLRKPGHKEIAVLDTALTNEFLVKKPEMILTSSDGEEIRYNVCNRTEGMALSGIGALFMGMVSTGLGEMNGYFLLQRCRVPIKVSVATSVLVVAVTALVASTGHFIQFARSGSAVLDTVFGLIIFTVPGVIIGGQIGSRIASLIPQRILELGLAILFILVAALTLARVIL